MNVWNNFISRNKIRAIKNLKNKLDNIPTTKDDLEYWKLNSTELLKKYLGDMHAITSAFESLKFNEDFGLDQTDFNNSSFVKASIGFLENGIQWIQEHGLKRNPWYVMWEYKEIFISFFAAGFTVGAFFSPPIQRWVNSFNNLEKVEIPTNQGIHIDTASRKHEIHPEKPIPIKRKTDEERPHSRKLTAAEQLEILSKIPEGSSVDIRVMYPDEESEYFAEQIDKLLRLKGINDCILTRYFEVNQDVEGNFKIENHPTNKSAKVIIVNPLN